MAKDWFTRRDFFRHDKINWPNMSYFESSKNAEPNMKPTKWKTVFKLSIWVKGNVARRNKLVLLYANVQNTLLCKSTLQPILQLIDVLFLQAKPTVEYKSLTDLSQDRWGTVWHSKAPQRGDRWEDNRKGKQMDQFSYGEQF